jgi:hypothetical protein
MYRAYSFVLDGCLDGDASEPAVLVSMALHKVNAGQCCLYARYSNSSGAAAAKANFEAVVAKRSRVRVKYVSEQKFEAVKALSPTLVQYNDISANTVASTTDTSATTAGAHITAEHAHASDVCSTTAGAVQHAGADIADNAG